MAELLDGWHIYMVSDIFPTGFVFLDPTHIVNGPQDMQVISGTTAQLMCQAEYDKSLADSFQVVWIKDGEEMTFSTEEHSRFADAVFPSIGSWSYVLLSTRTSWKAFMFRYFVGDGMLQIMNVNLNDEGVYTCMARTHLDGVNRTALLTVLGKALVWIIISTSFIYISWWATDGKDVLIANSKRIPMPCVSALRTFKFLFLTCTYFTCHTEQWLSCEANVC